MVEKRIRNSTSKRQKQRRSIKGGMWLTRGMNATNTLRKGWDISKAEKPIAKTRAGRSSQTIATQLVEVNKNIAKYRAQIHERELAKYRTQIHELHKQNSINVELVRNLQSQLKGADAAVKPRGSNLGNIRIYSQISQYGKDIALPIFNIDKNAYKTIESLIDTIKKYYKDYSRTFHEENIINPINLKLKDSNGGTIDDLAKLKGLKDGDSIYITNMEAVATRQVMEAVVKPYKFIINDANYNLNLTDNTNGAMSIEDEYEEFKKVLIEQILYRTGNKDFKEVIIEQLPDDNKSTFNNLQIFNEVTKQYDWGGTQAFHDLKARTTWDGKEASEYLKIQFPDDNSLTGALEAEVERQRMEAAQAVVKPYKFIINGEIYNLDLTDNTNGAMSIEDEYEEFKAVLIADIPEDKKSTFDNKFDKFQIFNEVTKEYNFGGINDFHAVKALTSGLAWGGEEANGDRVIQFPGDNSQAVVKEGSHNEETEEERLSRLRGEPVSNAPTPLADAKGGKRKSKRKSKRKRKRRTKNKSVKRSIRRRKSVKKNIQENVK